VRAGVVGVVLVIVIMVGYSAFPGARRRASRCTPVYAGGLAAFGFTLTLPGLAGFVLSIGSRSTRTCYFRAIRRSWCTEIVRSPS